METVQTLTEARDAAAQSFEELESQIARARLEGDGEALARLRGRRDVAMREADEANDAIALAEERGREDRLASEAARRQEAVAEAKRIAAERLDAAREVDGALAALEAAVSRYRTLGRDLGRLTGSSASVARRDSPNMRWAIWAAAPESAELLCVPFANGHRRRSLAQLEAGQ